MSRFFVFCFVCALQSIGCNAHADTIFAQTGPFVGGVFSDLEFGRIAADDFLLNEERTVASVTWWGVYSGPAAGPTVDDDFTMDFYAGAAISASGLINSIVVGNQAARHNVGDPIGTGLDTYQYDFVLDTPLTLAAGVYWISIYSDTSADNSTDDIWAWRGDTGPGGNTHRSLDNGQTWSLRLGNRNSYFVLADAQVPIPGAIWLFGSAITLLGWIRRKVA